VHQIVALVERTLDLQKRLPTTKTPQERTLLQRQIDGTEDGVTDAVGCDLFWWGG
jgi:hypothetical protein